MADKISVGEEEVKGDGGSFVCNWVIVINMNITHCAKNEMNVFDDLTSDEEASPSLIKPRVPAKPPSIHSPIQHVHQTKRLGWTGYPHVATCLGNAGLLTGLG